MNKPKFKVGQRYRTAAGNVIKISEMNGAYARYKLISGKDGGSNRFHINSLYAEELTLVCEKIVITTDGKTTTAKMYDGKKLVKSAKAECSPDDEFDFERGAGIAISRLLGYEFVPLEEKETLLNTKICIIKGDKYLKTGHIYEIVDGKFQCDVDGKSSTFPMEFRLKSIDELKAYLSYEHSSNRSHFSSTVIKFIEVVE